jgi:DNA-binding beta-propeller fold protein YncE/mono/diheme cytochrome c family protein
VHSLVRPIDGPQTGSMVALGKLGARRVAYVADEDATSVLTVDLESKQELARTRLGSTPGQLVLTKTGQLAVLLRDASEIQVFEADKTDGSLTMRCSAKTEAEPVGLALTPTEQEIVVTSGWGRTLAIFGAQKLDARGSVALPREPRGVVVSDDGKQAFVTHAVGSHASVVDLTQKQAKVRALRGEQPGMRGKKSRALLALPIGEKSRFQSCQGFALAKAARPQSRVLMPQVFVDPGDLENKTEGYGDNDTTETPSVAVLDSVTGAPLGESLTLDLFTSRQLRMDERDDKGACLLPRSAAVDPRTGTLLVGCFGLDAVVAYDGTSATPSRAEKFRVEVGAGATGIAIDDAARQAVVWAQFDRKLSIVNIPAQGTDQAQHVAKEHIAMAPLPPGERLDPAYALGRVLFHAAGDARVSKDGRACASCHPDGRDDAITWATPEGPRRSIMLAGRVSTSAPYSWLGKNKEIKEHLSHTFERLGGTGLRSIELDGLTSFVTQMKGPPPMRVDKAMAERGAKLFASKETACASCHSGSSYSDGAVHDVKSKVKVDELASFNTPSLKYVGSTGPYFHDGRYATLNALLRNSDGTMGHTKHLSDDDLRALEEFLKTL